MTHSFPTRRSSDLTPRFSLPLLAVAQAQKEVTHNEALTLLDALVHAAIEAGPLATPPANPALGQCWIVDAAATGVWSGAENAIAIRSEEHTSELQSLMRISSAVFCLKKKNT